jgi:seryl-tRNA synthetase
MLSKLRSNEQGDSINIDILDEKTPNMMAFMKAISTAIEETRQEMNAQLSNLTNSVKMYQAENQEIKRQLNDVTAELHNVKAANLMLKSEVHKLQRDESNYMVTIHGVPNNSDDVEELKKIGKLLEVDISDQQVADIYRIKTKTKMKPEPLVVKFTSKLTRKLLVANRKRKSILSCDLDMKVTDKRPVYINEYLTRDTMRLLNESKILKKKFDFKFVWPKGGVIFAKKNEESDLCIIENENTISEIISSMSSG